MKSKRTKSRVLDPWTPSIQKQIKSLIANIQPSRGTFQNSDVVKEIIVTALKAIQSNIGRGDLKILSRSIRELRYAFKIFRSYRHIRKVTIFGSARTPRKDKDYKMAKLFSKRLTENGFMAITGAGPGIMQAGNEGAGHRHSFGVNIKLPFEQSANPTIAHRPTYIDCRYFFTRKLVFVKETHACALFPGGFGTLDEAFEVLTLVQTGKSNPIPIVFVDEPGGKFWKSMNRFIHGQILKLKKISKEDLCLYKIVDSVDEAVEEILTFYSNYHSMRFVGKNLVMRFHKPIRPQQLAYLNKHFRDIITKGKYQISGPLNEEKNEAEILHLHRIVFNFNRMNNGRLRALIDYMNKS